MPPFPKHEPPGQHGVAGALVAGAAAATDKIKCRRWRRRR